MQNRHVIDEVFALPCRTNAREDFILRNIGPPTQNKIFMCIRTIRQNKHFVDDISTLYNEKYNLGIYVIHLRMIKPNDDL